MAKYRDTVQNLRWKHRTDKKKSYGVTLDLNVTCSKTYEILTGHLLIQLAYFQHFRCQNNRLAKFSHKELVRLWVVMRRECTEKKLLNAEIPNTSEIYNIYTIWVCSNEIGLSLHSITMSTLDLKELLKWLHFNSHTVGFCSYTRILKLFTFPVDRLFRWKIFKIYCFNMCPFLCRACLVKRVKKDLKGTLDLL